MHAIFHRNFRVYDKISGIPATGLDAPFRPETAVGRHWRAIRHHRAHGCCTSAAGGIKRNLRKGCRWMKRRGRVWCESDGADACVPALRITSRRWRSVIIVTPLRYLVAFGTNDPILPPFVRSRPCSRARPAFFHDEDTRFCSPGRRRSSLSTTVSARLLGGVTLISRYRFADRVPAVISSLTVFDRCRRAR